jgi:predicted O-methyltransferase YrrM
VAPTTDSAADRVRSRIEAIYTAGAAVDGDGEPVELYAHGVSRVEGEMLRDLVQEAGARTTIEVGFAMGLSTLFICEGLLRVGEPVRHVAIDPFQHHWRDTGVRTTRDAGIADLVEVVREPSQTCLPRLLEADERYDLAFVDGDHRFEAAFIDIYFLSRLVRPGGLIVIDDVWLPAVQKALRYFEANTELALQPGAHAAAFRWPRRTIFGRTRTPAGIHDQLAVLRVPESGGPEASEALTDF